MTSPRRGVPPIAEHEKLLPPPDSDVWNAGLTAAFAEEPDRQSSVLTRLGQVTGRDPRVLLRETGEFRKAALIKPVPDGEQRTGRYRILGEIARGGVGVILRGRDADLGRDLAVKVLRDDHAGNAELVQRFVEEAQIGGQLEHPGIVPVYELGVDEMQRPYFTMKLIQGETLARLLELRNSPDEDRVRFLRVFGQVCDAMGYTHARGVVHRDLKPANILVGSFGEVQVVDWGFAKVLRRGGVADEETAHVDRRDAQLIATVRSGPAGLESQVGSIMGTPSYMPPEQALGRVDALDERTDVFALGAILCEILTGRPPYVAESLAQTALKAQRADLAEAYARLDACGADEPLVALAHACLQEKPVDRPRDAGRLAAAIAEYLASLERRAHAAQVEAARALERANAERRTRRLQTVFGVCVGGALVVGAAVFLHLRANDRDRIARIESGIRTALFEAAQHERDGELELAVSALERARSLAAEPRLDRDLVRQVDETSRSTEGALRDAQLATDLEAVRSSDEAEATMIDDAYTAAFVSNGIDIATVTPEELRARTGHGTALARDVAFALDDWVWRFRPGRRGPPAHAARLVELAQTIDTDDWRNALRSAALERDAERLLELADEAQASERSPLGLDTLALALSAAQEHDAALALLERALRAHPGEFYLNFHAAVLLARHDPSRAADAEQYARIALALRPHSLGTRILLARQLMERGDMAGARSYLREVVSRDPEGARGHIMRARLYRKVGDTERALAVLDEIAATGRAVPPVHVARAAVLLGMGEAVRAREALLSAIAAERDLPGRGRGRGVPARPRPGDRRADGRGRARMQLDTDGDGRLTRAEVPEELRAVFDTLDQDGDGSLDRTEIRWLMWLHRELEHGAPPETRKREAG